MHLQPTVYLRNFGRTEVKFSILSLIIFSYGLTSSNIYFRKFIFQTTNWHLRRADGILMPSLRKYSSLYATRPQHFVPLQVTGHSMQNLSWATAHCSTFARHTKPTAQKPTLQKSCNCQHTANSLRFDRITQPFCNFTNHHTVDRHYETIH